MLTVLLTFQDLYTCCPSSRLNNFWSTIKFSFSDRSAQSKNLTSSATSCSLNLSASYLCSGQNKVFLIDWLFKWTLRRASNALVYSWASGGHCKPTSGSRSKPWWGIGGDSPGNFFYLYLNNGRKLGHVKNEIVVLFCTMSATYMFNIHRIKNSSFFYAKHVFLDISIKGQFDSNK